MPLIRTGGVQTLDIPADAIDTNELAANSVIDGKITALALTKAKNNADVLIRCTITIQQDGNAQTNARGYLPFAGDIVACTFMNDSGAAFTAAGKIAVTGGDVISSTANLADNTTERITAGLANNTGLAKTDWIQLTTGTTGGAGATIAIVEIEGQLKLVA